MITCPSCGAIVFVDMDGAAHVSGEDDAGADDAAQSVAQPVVQPEVPLAPLDPLALEPFSLEPMATQPMEPSPMEAPSADSPVPMELEPLSVEPAPEEPFAIPGMDVSSPHLGTPHLEIPQDEGPLDISAYANSEVSAARNGPIVVTLTISGIDSKDIRDEVRQALQDSRFGWDSAELMASVKSGVLKLQRLSPVKATILINRIKNLAVRIHWEQYAITEIDVAGAGEP
jgi:hypothetical protein